MEALCNSSPSSSSSSLQVLKEAVTVFYPSCENIIHGFFFFHSGFFSLSARSITITFLRSSVRGRTGWTFQPLERFPEGPTLHLLLEGTGVGGGGRDSGGDVSLESAASQQQQQELLEVLASFLPDCRNLHLSAETDGLMGLGEAL